MKYINQNLYKGAVCAAAVGILMSSCTADNLSQDPLSFYEPAATYSTESGVHGYYQYH